MKSANKDYNIILEKSTTTWRYTMDAAGWLDAVYVFKILMVIIYCLFRVYERVVLCGFCSFPVCCVCMMTYMFCSAYSLFHVWILEFQFLKSYLENDCIMFLNECELCSLVGAKWALNVGRCWSGVNSDGRIILAGGVYLFQSSQEFYWLFALLLYRMLTGDLVKI